MNKLNKVFLVVLVSVLSITSMNANASRLRVLLKAAVILGETLVNNKPQKTFKRSLGEAVVINGITMHAISAYAQEKDFEYNQHGVKYQEEKGTIYLGKGCEVESPVYGQGVWGWDDKGWYVLINDDKTVLSYGISELPRFSPEVLETCNLRSFN